MNHHPCRQCRGTVAPEAEVGRGFCSEACKTEFERPVPGKPCTYAIGSDYYPMTIVAVSPSGSKLTVRADRPLGGGKFDPGTGESEFAYRTKDGWYRLGRAGRLYIGERDMRLDPSF